MTKACKNNETLLRWSPLVSSQERRAAVVPRIKRSSITRQQITVFLGSVCNGFNIFMLPTIRPSCFSPVWKSTTKGSALGAPLRLASPGLVPARPARLRPALPSRVLPRPAPRMGCPSLGFIKFG